LKRLSKKIRKQPDMNVLGDVLHTAIATYLIDPEQKEYPDLVQDLVDPKGLNGMVETADVVRGATDLARFVKTAFNPKRIWAKHPLVHVWENGQIARGWIDVLLETDTGWILIDHKITHERAEAVVRNYAGQLAAYVRAVQAATREKVLSYWIHLPLTGVLLQVEVNT
jgi:ATP-dependent exoDNAse (exonuclease V) beta subunit